MSATQYKYVIATSTLNGKVEADSLATEIHGSAIVTSLDHIDTNDTEVGITFKSALSGGDQTLLTQLLAAHEGVPLAKPPETVRVLEDSDELSDGKYQAMTITVDVGSGVDSTYVVDTTFPYAISLYSASWIHDTNMEGDIVTVSAGPDTIIGALTSDAAIGDTVLNVQQSVIDNTKVGYELKLFDGTNQDDLGRVLAIDQVNNTITVETATVNAFAAATPSYIQQTIVFIKEAVLKSRYDYQFGEDVIGGSYIPAGFTTRVHYTNKEGTAKKLVVLVEYKY